MSNNTLLSYADLEATLVKSRYKMLQIFLIVGLFSSIFVSLHYLSSTNTFMITQGYIVIVTGTAYGSMLYFLKKDIYNFEILSTMLLIITYIVYTSGNILIDHLDDKLLWYSVLILVAYSLKGKRSGHITSFIVLITITILVGYGLIDIPSESLFNSVSVIITLWLFINVHNLRYQKEQQGFKGFNSHLLSLVKEKSRQLYHNSFIDLTTKAMNRSAFFRDIEQFQQVKLALVSINDFPDISNTFGSTIVHQLLQTIYNNTKEILYDKGYSIYRISANEMAIVSDQNHSEKHFFKNIHNLVESLEQEIYTFDEDNIEIEINLSASICYEKERVLEKAGVALQQSHKKKIVPLPYDDSMSLQQYQQDNIRLSKSIKEAIRNNGIFLNYQPIVDRDQKIIKYEVLVRMRSGDVTLSPYQFLDFSKKTKYYQQISQIVIIKSFNHFSQKDIPFSVNLSFDDITNEDMVLFILNKLRGFAKPENVTFELLESEDLYNLEYVSQFISNVKALGAKIAVDDFGSGYSNFSRLNELDIDILKIDGSLIQDIHKYPERRYIVESILQLSQKLGLTTVAEFVTDETIFEATHSLGFDQFQGYHFGKPSEVC